MGDETKKDYSKHLDAEIEALQNVIEKKQDQGLTVMPSDLKRLAELQKERDECL